MAFAGDFPNLDTNCAAGFFSDPSLDTLLCQQALLDPVLSQAVFSPLVAPQLLLPLYKIDKDFWRRQGAYRPVKADKPDELFFTNEEPMSFDIICNCPVPTTSIEVSGAVADATLQPEDAPGVISRALTNFWGVWPIFSFQIRTFLIEKSNGAHKAAGYHHQETYVYDWAPIPSVYISTSSTMVTAHLIPLVDTSRIHVKDLPMKIDSKDWRTGKFYWKLRINGLVEVETEPANVCCGRTDTRKRKKLSTNSSNMDVASGGSLTSGAQPSVNLLSALANAPQPNAMPRFIIFFEKELVAPASVDDAHIGDLAMGLSHSPTHQPSLPTSYAFPPVAEPDAKGRNLLHHIAMASLPGFKEPSEAALLQDLRNKAPTDFLEAVAASNKIGQTPIANAAYNRRFLLARLFLEYLPSERRREVVMRLTTTKSTMLHSAASGNNLAFIRYVLEDLNLRTTDLKYLLSTKSNVGGGETVLGMALFQLERKPRRYWPTAQYIMKKCRELDVVDDDDDERFYNAWSAFGGQG
ncbi:hypothetical protein BDK51DRAFT_38455 [Blyttiomyces helicus]|uniref:Uncharacterized protein n=1 Tax=Blyttiomyces helicus TaxID=388810 RepID=A0A4P9W7V2_9FUNG|nr:hypothetical protein BDK51DRAFT_38455 [Blyttiomyces helicus]|eukprot:RKO87128.1 hypothetical protein BDK51DRAFT_38455 [Blyttiomyces helicus]